MTDIPSDRPQAAAVDNRREQSAARRFYSRNGRAINSALAFSVSGCSSPRRTGPCS
jgi:hypothetical protein